MIGLGTAKSIEVSWEYNQKFVCKRNSCFFGPSTNSQNINYLSKDGICSIYPPFDYLASIIQTEDRFKADISFSEDTENEKIYVIDANRPQKNINTYKVLKLELLYEDKHGNPATQTFNLEVWAITKIGTPNSYYINLKFKKKNTCKINIKYFSPTFASKK
jgi:hypothetical protein